MPVRAALQLGSELDALRLTAGQRRCALAKPHVAEADLDQRLQVAVDRRDRLEEFGRLGDRHVEHLGDVLALVVDGQRVAVVARPTADLAGDIDVGKEVHLDRDGAVARAVLAAAALDVEAETAGQVSARLGLRGLGEQRADLVEHARVGGGVRSRGAADRRLVDVHDLVELSSPVTRVCSPGICRAPLSSLASTLYRMSLTSDDLPEPLTPVTAVKTPSGKLDVNVLAGCSPEPPRP